MRCPHAPTVFRLHQGELDPETARHITEHCANCRTCGKLFEFVGSLKNIPPLQPPDDLSLRVMEHVYEHDPPRGGNGFFSAFRGYPVAAPAALAIALLLILVLARPNRQQSLVRLSVAIPVEGAGQVALAGDFNNWDSSRGQLRRDGNTWKGTFLVPPGRYQYMLVIDGKEWRPDPTAKEFVDDGYGSRNSLIDTARI